MAEKKIRLQYKLPESILSNINKVLGRVSSERVAWLRDTIEENPYVLSHKYYEQIRSDRKYCLIAILAKINGNEFKGKSELEKVLAAHRFAVTVRSRIYNARASDKESGNEPMLFEQYFKDRFERSTNDCFLTQNEVFEIITLCDKILQQRNYLPMKASEFHETELSR